MKKTAVLRFVSLLLIIVCFSQTFNVISYDSEEHNRMMRYSFFRKGIFKYYGEKYIDDKQNDNLKILEAATYLVLDYYNTFEKGSKDLDYLRSMRVAKLPDSVNEIDYSSNSHHRAYTHLGWDHNYINDRANFEVRKEILLNAANRIFTFDNEKQRNSFCAIVYYIHLLGDRKYDTENAIEAGKDKLTPASELMEVGGRHYTDKNDIIDELITHIGIVFSKQSNTHKYRGLMASLEKKNKEFEKIVRSDGGINSAEKIKEYGKLTESVCKTLYWYLPEMLKDESFFRNVFYK